jgi:hypothetical protein
MNRSQSDQENQEVVGVLATGNCYRRAAQDYTIPVTSTHGSRVVCKTNLKGPRVVNESRVVCKTSQGFSLWGSLNIGEGVDTLVGM